MFPIPVWQQGTLQPSTPVNEALLRIEVLERAATSILSAPPGSPAQRQMHIVGTSPSGAWSGFAVNDVVIFIAATWHRFAPFAGWLKEVDGKVRRFDGSAWVVVGGSGSGGVPVQDEGATVVAAPTAINFTGAGVTASNAGGVATVNIPGGSGSSDRTTHTGDFEQFPLLATAVANPAAGFGRVYIGQRAGRNGISMLLPSGFESMVETSWPSKRKMVIEPSSGAGLTSIGIGTTVTGLISHPALATTSLARSIHRAEFLTGASAGSSASVRHNLATIFRGNADALGGFYFHARVCSGNIALAGGEAFIGLSSSMAALAGAPSALADAIGLVKDVADTAWQFTRRTGTGAVQKVALTTPLTYAANQTIDVIMFSRPGGTGIWCVVRSFNNAGVATTHLDTEYTTDLPQVTTFLGGRFDVRNGATAAAANFDLVRMHVESDF